MFSDIHLGRRNNSLEHLQDCGDFVDWFIEKAAETKATDIVFLGDFFETRANISIVTLDWAYDILRRLNNTGLPVWFLVGNHDLAKRNTRDIYSTNVFNEFTNFQVVSEVIKTDRLVFAPYLFHDEYPSLAQLCHSGVDYVFGHLEFQGFSLTGYNTILEHGPSHKHFGSVKHIFCGHFHKRQAADNVIYIGNTFPLDFGDVDDDARGACVLEEDGSVYFLNWEDCPRFRRFKLSEIDSVDLTLPKTRAECMVDYEIDYTDAQELREMMKGQVGLRDFNLKDCTKARAELLSEEKRAEDIVVEDIDVTVVKMLETISDNTIDGARLASIYKSL